jgi:phage antirepressor YoqD-like protein/phage regulator Rha-like protein
MISDNHQENFPNLDKLIEEAPEVITTPVSVMPAGVPVMSSLQIAEITGKDHAHVMRDIRNVLGEAEIDQSKFGSIRLDGGGREQPCYLLPRRECDLVISGYSVKYRLAIIDRWHELEAKAAAPVINLDDPAFLRGLLLANVEKQIALETTVSELTPKAEALERIAGTEGLMNITTAAKTLQVSPKRLFGWLDTHGWTYRRPGNAERVPYQSKIAQGLMKMKAHRYTNAKTGEDVVAESSLITAKGLAKLATASI